MKSAFKIVVILLPVFFIIGVLRRYFGQANFLPDPDTLSKEFSRFPSIQEEIFGLNRIANSYAGLGEQYFAQIGASWNNVKDIVEFFQALGNTFKFLGLGIVHFLGGLGALILLPFAVISYPLQAIAWFGGIVGFAS